MRITGKVLGIGVLAAAMLLTACSTGAGTSSKGSIDPAAKKAAVAAVAEASKVPQANTPTTLSTKAPTGKSGVFITCPLPICAATSGEFVKAATALGWSTRLIVAEFTPESFVGAFESALQLSPDYVGYIATQPYDVIKDTLPKFKAAGIPVVVNSPSPDTPIGGDSPIVGAGSGANVTEKFSTLQADIVIADADNLDNVTFMYDPSSPAYIQGHEVFVKQIAAAGGKVHDFEINQADAGATLLGQVVSYLQRNPDTEYLVVVNDGLVVGLPDAIAAAGLESPKIIGSTTVEQSIEYLKKGTQFGSVQPDSYGSMWDMVDILAHIDVGDTYDDQPLGAVMAVNKDNAAEVPAGTFAGVPDNYLKAWLLK